MFPQGLTQFGEKRATDGALAGANGCMLLFLHRQIFALLHLLYAPDLNGQERF